MTERFTVQAGILVALLFWAGLALAGFPRPYLDDAIMVGPTLGLRDAGFLDNVLLSRDFYPEPAYLFYPPVFSWALLGWVALFGQGFSAMAGFWAACCAAASIALGLSLRRQTGYPWSIPAACVLLLGCVAFTGLRMEILGFATFFAGLALGVDDRPTARAAGYFLLFATPTIAPTFLGYAFVASVTLFLLRRSAREVVLAGVALAMAVLALVLACQGEIVELVRTMYSYRSIRIGLGGREEALLRLVLALGVGSAISIAICLIWVRSLGSAITAAKVIVPIVLVAGFALSIATHSRLAIWIGYALAQMFLLTVALQALIERHGIRIAPGCGWLRPAGCRCCPPASWPSSRRSTSITMRTMRPATSRRN